MGGVRRRRSPARSRRRCRGPLDQYLGTGDQPIDEDCLTLNVWTPGLRRRPPAGARVDPRRRLHHRRRIGALVRRGGHGGQRRRRRRHAQLPPRRARLHLPGRARRRSRPPATSACSTRSPRCAGSRPTPPGSAATPATSRSSASRPAAPASSPCWPRPTPPPCSTRPSSRARRSASCGRRPSRPRRGRPARAAAGHAGDAADAHRSPPRRAGRRARWPRSRPMLVDPMAWFTAFSPVADGVVLPPTVGEVLDAAARSDVPVLIGTVRDEMQLFTALDPAYLHLDDARARRPRRVRCSARRRRSRSTPTAAPARPPRPASSPRPSPRTTASACPPSGSPKPGWPRAARPGCTCFTWPSPTFGGLLGACHGIELPFVFHNLAQPGVELLTGTGAERGPLRGRRAGGLAAVRPRRPPGLARLRPRRPPTMRFDTECGVVADPEADLRKVWTQP